MIAIADSDDRYTIHVSRSFGTVDAGYRVTLHDLPAYTFLVDAPSVDAAQRIAFHIAHREGRAKSDAATVQRF